jgi:hypothetical protein
MIETCVKARGDVLTAVKVRPVLRFVAYVPRRASTGATVFIIDDFLLDEIKDAAAMAVYIGVLRNLLSFKQKLAKNYGPRRNSIDEIVLHGTESLGTQEQSATYLQGETAIHYFIGRDNGLAYQIVPEEYQSFHAGNPKGHPNVQDHNPKSIGPDFALPR